MSDAQQHHQQRRQEEGEDERDRVTAALRAQWSSFVTERNMHAVAFITRAVDPQRHPARLAIAFFSWSYFCFWVSHTETFLSQLFLTAAVASASFYLLVTYQRKQFKRGRALSEREVASVDAVSSKCFRVHAAMTRMWMSLHREGSEAQFSWVYPLKLLVVGMVFAFGLSLFSFIALFYILGLCVLVFVSNARVEDAIASLIWLKSRAISLFHTIKKKKKNVQQAQAQAQANSKPPKNKKSD